VVTLECLSAFDYLQWLRTGARAAEFLHCNQSTISRQAHKCHEVFGVSLIKKNSEWHINGNSKLLDAERLVHQRFRWDKDLPLRIESQHWMRHYHSDLNLHGWVKGNLNYLEYERPEYLLANRIIDAWLCSSPDLPTNPELKCIQLCSMPSILCVKSLHPLVALGPSITLEDVRKYPLLPLPKDQFPVFSKQISALGLGDVSLNLNSSGQHLDTELAIEDLVVGIASPLTLELFGSDVVILPLNLSVTVGDALIIRSEFAEHPRTHKLIHKLMDHIGLITSKITSVHASIPDLTPVS
jgi:DNA-binding transcriptional LysR family regulator